MERLFLLISQYVSEIPGKMKCVADIDLRSSLLVKRHSQSSFAPSHQSLSMMLVSFVYEGHFRSMIPQSRISSPWEMLQTQEPIKLPVRHSDKLP